MIFTKRTRATAFFTFIIALPVLLSFQNCGRVDLRSSAGPATLVNLKTGYGEFCLPVNYTMESFFVSNLNLKPSQYGLFKDSDGDGLTDAEEAIMGSDPLSRRSGGYVLDSICRDVDFGPSCENFKMTCDTTENSLGINECDTLALQISKPASMGGGIDSDNDGIPDFLELRIGSFPNLDDALNDLDLDQVNGMTEAELGTSVRENNKLILNRDKIQISKTRLTKSSCEGEAWSVEVKNMPVILTEYFTDLVRNSLTSRGDRYSHKQNENVIQTFLKIKPINTNNGLNKTKSYTWFQKAMVDETNSISHIRLDFQISNLFSVEVEP